MCSDTPGPGERVECTEGATSDNDIDLTLKGIDIGTTDNDGHGVSASHEGSGDIIIDIQPGSDENGSLTSNYIDTIGGEPANGTDGIFGRHVGSGDVIINAQNLHITTTGNYSDGIQVYTGYRGGTGDLEEDLPPAAASGISVNVSNSTIAAEGDFSNGIIVENYGGEGEVNITVRNSTITTKDGRGVYGLRIGETTGDIRVTVDQTSITTESRSDIGIDVDHKGEDDANIYIDVTGGSITTKEYNGYAVRGFRSLGTGNIEIDVVGGTVINTAGTHGRGIDAYMYDNNGNIDVDAEDIDVTTSGEQGHGIRTRFQQSADDDKTGDILVDVQGGMITTKNVFAYGLYNRHQGIGILDIDVRDLDISTESTGIYQENRTLSHGIYGEHNGNGDIDINVRGGSITTLGSYSYGIYGTHSGTGDIIVNTQDGNAITTTGDNGHGIVAYHHGTEDDTRSIDITIGGTVDATGADAHAIRIGVVNEEGEPEQVAGLDADGYRNQTVTVNGQVTGGTGDGAGVYLAGGGKVFIGPQGTIGADSGIAIRATGGTAPKLLVDMNLDGREVREVIGDDYILNDGGETTIVVNEVTLHDGEMGVTGKSAANGAWDVTMRNDGLTVDTSTDPWTISSRSTGTKIDRDFSADDFEETERPVFIEEYAPRAAVYEALPGFLLRLTEQGSGWVRHAAPIWMKFSDWMGSLEPKRSTVGATYDFDTSQAEVGLSASLSEDADVWLSMRYVSASARVSSPTGSGEIRVRGKGPALGVFWSGADGYYASGTYSMASYDMDFSSDKRGSLKTSAGGYGYSLGLEGGRRITLDRGMTLSPRARVNYSNLSIEKFTDAVNSRVSVPDAAHFVGTIGVEASTSRIWDGGVFSLRGSLDVERKFSGAETAVYVSGERLSSESPKNRTHLGVVADYHKGRFSFGASVAQMGLDSDDREYSGRFTLGMQF